MSVGAAGDAAAAEHALGGVADEGGGELVEMSLGLDAGVLVLFRAGDGGDVEELALAVLLALLAVFIVVGEQELNASSAGLNGLGRGDADLHALGYGVDAAGDEASRSGGLNEADAAGADVALAVVKGAKGGDLITAGLRSLKYGHAGFDLIGDAFDFNIDFRHLLIPPYLFSIAPNLQVDIQAPHFTQAFGSISMAASFLPGAT